MMLDINCTVDRAKRPEWMKRLVSFLSVAQRKTYEGTGDEMRGIRQGIDSYLRQLMYSRVTDLKLDSEQTADNAVLIRKNGRTFVEIRFAG